MEKENQTHSVYKELLELRWKNVAEVDRNDCQCKKEV
jgi:hypothetical protein